MATCGDERAQLGNDGVDLRYGHRRRIYWNARTRLDELVVGSGEAVGGRPFLGDRPAGPVSRASTASPTRTVEIAPGDGERAIAAMRAARATIVDSGVIGA
jgi:hypothetical protein